MSEMTKLAVLAQREIDKSVVMRKILHIITIIILTIFSLIMFYPLVFMILIGLFKTQELQSTIIGFFPIPKFPTMDNFLLLFNFPRTNPNFIYYLGNSLGRTALAIVATCITTFICGYTFARIKFRGSRSLLLFLIMLSFLPGTLTLIPTYLIYLNFPFGGPTGIIDTWWVYAIGAPGINVMGTFVVKQFMETLPSSLDESAKIDGANTFTIMFKILFPLCLPIMAYTAITTGIGTWNDWSTSFFFTMSDKLQVIPAILSRMSLGSQSGMAVPNYPAMVSISMIVTVPSLLIFIFFQKYIVEGIANTGIKG